LFSRGLIPVKDLFLMRCSYSILSGVKCGESKGV
jgi:hypothetical protein